MFQGVFSWIEPGSCSKSFNLQVGCGWFAFGPAASMVDRPQRNSWEGLTITPVDEASICLFFAFEMHAGWVWTFRSICMATRITHFMSQLENAKMEWFAIGFNVSGRNLILGSCPFHISQYTVFQCRFLGKLAGKRLSMAGIASCCALQRANCQLAVVWPFCTLSLGWPTPPFWPSKESLGNRLSQLYVYLFKEDNA